MLGIDREDDHLEQMEQISFQQAEAELKKVHSKTVLEEKLRSKKLLTKGFISDFAKSDMY